jgi:hypothetical protein
MILFAEKFNWLEKLHGGVESQHGEDSLVRALFEKYLPRNKVCVEIGAGDGRELSNTWDLINNDGWQSLQVESDSKLYESLAKRYQDNSKVKTLNHEVARTDLDGILKDHSIPKNFDYLSLDIDGYDYEVWKNMKYSPNIVVIECNSQVEDLETEDYQPIYNGNYGGATAGILNQLATKKGYEFVCFIKCNMIYIKKEFMNEG